MTMHFGRLITAMVTPFRDDGSVDLDGAARLADHLVAHGSEALVVAGTTGESPTLSHQEKRELLSAIVPTIAGRAKVIAGTGTYDTAESVALSQMAASAGVDGLLVVTPYYSRPPQSGLLAHFTTIANSIELPVVLYDIPSRTGRKIEHATLLELSTVPNIIGVKDAAGDLAGTARLAADAPGFTIWSGDDVLTLPMLSVGAVGVVSVASHLVGNRLAEMIRAHEKGDVEGAAAIHHQLLPLFDVLFITANPIPVKTALRMLGLPAGGLRLPLVEASDEETARIRIALTQHGLL